MQQLIVVSLMLGILIKTPFICRIQLRVQASYTIKTCFSHDKVAVELQSVWWLYVLGYGAQLELGLGDSVKIQELD